jgi:prepilin peptidase CpaA
MLSAYPLSATAALVTFLGATVIVDLRKARIPNLLTVPAALFGLGLNLAAAGGSGVVHSGAGLLTGLAVFLPFYLAGGFGGGDVKAMAAVGAFLGPKGALLAAAFTLVAGAVGALLVLASLGEHAALRALIRRWSLAAFAAWTTHTLPRTAAPADDATQRRFPYGLAIACGTVVALTWS